MIQRNFKLALTAGRTIPLVIPASQYDSGEQWIFTLIDETGAKYAPASGAIIGIKSDKMAILNAGTVDAAGRVVINETEQMTAAVGKNVYEILINDQTHGSANFIVMVEPRPGDNADFSDSDLSLLQQAIDGTSETAIKAGVQEWMDENLTDPTDPIVDASLSLSGAAADAKKTGDEISDLKSALNEKASISTSGDYVLLDAESGGAAQRYSVPSQSAFDALKEQVESGSGDGLTTDIKSALLQLADFVAYINKNGRQYRNALYDALYPPIVYTAITLDKSSMSFNALNATQQLTATTTPRGGDVTWSSSDTSIATVSSTGLVTSVDYGNVTITATCGRLTATCSVVVAQATVTSISASYNQGSKVVYDTASLDDLKADLTVTAHYSDNTSGAVTGYTLSGTLTEGTSTITVEYGGQTTTFNVTVTKYVTPPTFYFAPSNSDKLVENVMINDQGMPVSNTGSYYVDEFIECLATAPLNSSLAFEVPNRTAFYDSSKEFLSRIWVQMGIAHNDDATYCKLGWANSGSTSASYLLAVGACNDIFTNTGYRVNSTGVLEASIDEDSASDYIEIDSSATKFILYATAGTAKYVYRLVFYDNNKEFISYFNTVANGSSYLGDIPANAKYFRASAPVDHMTCGFPIMVEL